MREVTDKERNIAKHLVDSLATFPIGTEISLRVLGEATYEKLCSEGKQNEPWMQDLNDVILNFEFGILNFLFRVFFSFHSGVFQIFNKS